jgi:hypothetical protein
MSNFWINDQGQNLLKGTEDTPNNKERIPLQLIAEFLQEYPKARTDLMIAMKQLNEEETARIQDLVRAYPVLLKGEKYPQEREDDFQSNFNDLVVNQQSNLPKGNTDVGPSESSGLVVRRP